MVGLGFALFRLLGQQKNALQRIEEECLYGSWVLFKQYTHTVMDHNGWEFFNPDRGTMLYRKSKLAWGAAIPDKEIIPGTALHITLCNIPAENLVLGDPENPAHAPFVDQTLQTGVSAFRSICDKGHIMRMPPKIVEDEKGLLYWLTEEGLFDRDLVGTLIVLLSKISRKKRTRFLQSLVSIAQSQETFEGAEPSAQTHFNMKAAHILQNDFVENPDQRTRATGISIVGMTLEDIRDR